MKRLFLIFLIASLPLGGQSQEAIKPGTSDTGKQETGEKKKGALPGGYGESAWGATLGEVLKNITGKLYYTDERSVIISRDGELEYTYGFFTRAEDAEGRLLYVSLAYPYLAYDEVRKKYTESFGEPQSETLNENQGAIAWTSDATVIILWVDRYEKKPFSRRVTYISRELAREANTYQHTVFNRVELDLLKKLAP